MRKIKFRMWDTYNKKMIPERGGFYLGSPASEVAGGPDYPVMQYTGLKDRNGKEIYEGDIVKALVSLKDEAIYAMQHNTINLVEAIAKVEYWPPSFELDFGFMRVNLSSSCEIIGNIYENPELLKKTESKEKEF